MSLLYKSCQNFHSCIFTNDTFSVVSSEKKVNLPAERWIQYFLRNLGKVNSEKS